MGYELVQSAQGLLHHLHIGAVACELQRVQDCMSKAAIIADGAALMLIERGEKCLACILQIFAVLAPASGLLQYGSHGPFDEYFKRPILRGHGFRKHEATQSSAFSRAEGWAEKRVRYSGLLSADAPWTAPCFVCK
mmetsp:Transcript_14179/g.35006  ORF Transcript_14179/g.35006 Transcript_14179/m.35006 type:complete len:136 (-) Transcript_14179:92-499(-)